MANSDPNEMRIQRIEQAIVQLTTILTEQSERTDSGFNQLHQEIHGVRNEVHTMRGDLNTMRGDLNTMREAITDRLDRLINVTVQARTHDIERFADIERRLARLEGRVGV
jgi:chromosome segregation ATPase